MVGVGKIVNENQSWQSTVSHDNTHNYPDGTMIVNILEIAGKLATPNLI
jgi:hypothetical protein